MREIKFRAWSQLDNEMFYLLPEEIGDYLRHDDGITMMQYTGLKDKNGKEIYEGDIINVFNWGVKNSEFLGVTRVVWDNDECGWRYANNSGELAEDFYDEFRSVEVIGNIHENPELLS